MIFGRESPNDVTGNADIITGGSPLISRALVSFSIDLDIYTCTQSAENDDFQCSGTLDTCMGDQCQRNKAK